jgi:hypothetical protein
MRRLIAALALWIWIWPDTALAKTMLFGGSGHKEYLGCLECSEFASDSICNGFGKFGSEFSSSGIFNEFAGYGNEFSSKSPWNEFATSNEVPVLVDENGKFFGYFTINEHRPNSVSFAPTLYKLFKTHRGDLEKVRVALCGALGKGS